ncbi:TIGR04104 family putative zinc finger protein [Virgibacillus siamensis]|uniref:TIGR04104 family putative zinc finger protein n=1 Tax=Virgibacillus siamensis TaxID=480071 RepID=UPI00158A01F3|nr:TIGR04104 family putative zinc finger protein [Virgibacillus siamensis]
MSLPECWSCKYIFKWGELLFFIDGHKKCPKCGEKQYITTHSHWKSGFYSLALLLILFILNIFDLTVTLTAIFTFLSLVVVLSLIPFKLEFTNDREPFF